MPERDEAFETWLRTEVVAAHDELKADPSRALTVDEVRQHLAEQRKRMEADRESDSREGEQPSAHLHRCTPASAPVRPYGPV